MAFFDYLRLLSKRRWTAIPVLASIVSIVAVLTYTATPIFEARAQLLIEAETQNIVTFKEVVEQEMSTVEYYTTQFRILQSRALARVTLEKLGLWNHPEFIGTLAKDSGDGQSVRSRDMLTNALAAIEEAVVKVLGSSRVDNLGAWLTRRSFQRRRRRTKMRVSLERSRCSSAASPSRRSETVA